jgi:hypothetical protein
MPCSTKDDILIVQVSLLDSSDYFDEQNTLETSGEQGKPTLETSGEQGKTTLETSGEKGKTTLETSGEQIPIVLSGASAAWISPGGGLLTCSPLVSSVVSLLLHSFRV